MPLLEDMKVTAKKTTAAWKEVGYPARQANDVTSVEMFVGTRVNAGQLQMLPETTRKNLILHTSFSLDWSACGLPTFRLTHGLISKLLLTDCTGIAFNEVHWPFQSFAIQLPGPDPFIVYNGADGSEILAEVVLFHRFGLPVTELPGEMIERLSKQSVETGVAYYYAWAMARKEIWCAVQGANETMLHRYHKEPSPEDRMEDFLTEGTSIATAQDNDGGDYTDLDGRALRAAIRLIVNLAIYLADLSASGEWTPTPIAQGKSKRRAPERTWTLGRSIKLSPEVRRAALSGSEGAKWKLESRFIVRGHYRQQVCGKGRQERKRIWVEPFWKGPQDGERLERAYDVA